MERNYEFPPPTTPNEEARLRELESLGLLDTPSEKRFDRLTRLSALLAGAPTAWFCLIDDDRQWFKSTYGTECEQTARRDAICAYAILGEGPLVVEDVQNHSFFGDHSTFQGLPEPIGSYIGIPVRGVYHREPIGTLAVAGEEPRTFQKRHRQGLKMLREELEAQLKLHVLRRQIAEQRQRLEHIIGERDEMFRSIRSRAIDLAGVLKSDAGFIERLSDKKEIVEAARDIGDGGETIEDILEMSEGYVMWSTGQLKMLSAKMQELSD